MEHAHEKKNQLPWWKTPRAQKVGAGVGVVILIGLISWWFFFHPYVSTDDARVAMTLIRVAPAGVGGRIDKVNVVEGTKVKKGDVLVELDHRIPQANVDREKSKAELTARDYERLQRLVKEGSATAQALDQSKAAAATAAAELKHAEVILENTYLKAPFDGIIVQKMADPGNLLEPGQTAIVVADDVHPWIAANIEETAIAPVNEGQKVFIEIDEGGSLEGTVLEVRSAAAAQFALIPSDTGSGNYTKVVQRIPIRIEVKDLKNRTLRAGESVEIKIKVH